MDIEKKYETYQLVLCSLFCMFIFWILIKIMLNANIIDNPFLYQPQIKQSTLLKIAGKQLPSLNSDCPFCCQDKNNLIKFRATKPCDQIKNNQCIGLSKEPCNYNKGLCAWDDSVNKCINDKNFPYDNIPCSDSFNVGCTYAVTDSF